MISAARTLLDAFLSDRHSSNPIGSRPPSAGRTVEDLADVDPLEISQSVVVVEPWEHVGQHPSRNSGVIASENIAYITDQILGAETLIVPAWRTGVGDPRRFASLARGALFVVFEGGEPDVHQPNSFTNAYPRHAACRTLVELMLREVPFVAICLSHQLAAQAHVELIRDATDRLAASEIPAFADTADRIRRMGDNLRVEKDYGTVATSWKDDSFAVARNEQASLANTRLYPYRHTTLDHVPRIISDAHRVVSRENDAIIDVALEHENEISIQTFHGNEVSEESVRFACWAYREIHSTIRAYEVEAAGHPDLRSLLGAPCGVEILASTHTETNETLCEVAATGIYSPSGRKAITTQFHPELDASLLTTSQGWAPAWR
ncbi:hypothetical protein MK489_25195, partial [Myxococcota bacterium]|nr:hypothetical protein [Myxococcota bacterium]